MPRVLRSWERAWLHVVYIRYFSGILVQHDPVTTLDLVSPPRLTSYSHNVHNRVLEVAPGLKIAVRDLCCCAIVVRAERRGD